MNRCCTGHNRRFLWLTTAVLLSAASPAPFAVAQPSSAPMIFDIKASPLDQALKAYAERLHSQMLYDARLVAGRRTPAVKGHYTAKAALQRLLAGTDIQADAPTANTIVLRPRASAETDPRPRAAAPPAPVDVARLNTQDIDSSPHLAAGGEGKGPRGIPLNTPSVAEIVVTGTHLRGVIDSPSPVVVVIRQDMDRRGTVKANVPRGRFYFLVISAGRCRRARLSPLALCCLRMR